LGAVTCGAILLAPADGARAAKLRDSTLTVNVLSVDRQCFNREEFKDRSRETTSFAAKAQILAVLNNEHGLSPGAVIEIRYDVVVWQPRLPGIRDSRTLKTGETVTLTVIGEGTTFQWQWTGRERPCPRPSSGTAVRSGGIIEMK